MRIPWSTRFSLLFLVLLLTPWNQAYGQCEAALELSPHRVKDYAIRDATLTWKLPKTPPKNFRVYLKLGAPIDPKSELGDASKWLVAKEYEGTSFVVPTTLKTGAEYYWLVTSGCTKADEAYPAENAVFSTTSCAKPSNKAPADGANVSPTVTFSWTAVANASKYTVFVRVGSATAAPQAIGSTAPPTTALDYKVDPTQIYYWFVVADSSDGCDQRQSTQTSFTTCPIAAPGLVAPKNGATGVASPVVFTWTEVAGAVGYDLFVSENGGASKRIAAGLTTKYELAVSGTVSWYVEAIFSEICRNRSADTFEFTVKEPCPTAAPTLIAPEVGSTEQSPVVFSWNGVDGATGYELFVAEDGSAYKMIQTGLDTSWKLDVSGTVSWYVEAVFAEGCRTQSAKREFKVAVACSTEKPASLSPNGVSDVPSPVKLTWNVVGGANGYEVFVSQDGSAYKSLGTTELTSLSASLSGAVSWYVEAIFDAPCERTRSATADFKVAVACPTGAPTLLSPANGAIDVAAPVKFTWSAVEGAVKYELFAADNGATTFASLGTTSETSLVRSVSGTVTWYVEANFEGACKKTASARFEFKVGEAACPTGVPTLLSPANGATGVPSPVKFSWTAVDGAISYELFVSQNGEPFLSGGTTEATSLSKALSGTVAWYVEAVFPGKCERGRSAKREFKVTEACPTGAPKLLSPANGASDVSSPVQFSWSAVDGAIEYELFARVSSTTFDSLGTTTATSLTRSLSGGVAWYVEAVFSGKCERGRSATFEFKVAEATCPSEGPALGTPAEGATVESPVIFTWKVVPGALKYALGIRPAGSADPFKEVTTAATNAELKLSVGEYEWRVVAYPDKCNAVTSATRKLAVRESSTCGTNKPVDLVFPPDGETFKTDVVKFVWTLVEGAASYDLQVSQDGGTWRTLGSTREEGIVLSVPKGKVAWRVLAQFPGCPPLASLPRSIEVVLETCSPTPPSVTSPPEGSTVQSPVLLEWSAVPSADYYRVFASIDGGPIANVSGLVTATSYEAALPSGTIVWYVEAVSKACGSTFSSKSRFLVEKRGTCPTVGPELVSPADGATNVARTVVFSWKAVAGAVSYELFVSIDGGAPASLGVTKDIAFEREMRGEKIVWFVHAITPGCEPVPSSRWSFALAPDDACAIAAPLRILPTDNSSGVSPVEFQWTSSGTGTYYRLWIARDGEREVVLAETLDTGVKRHLEPGSYAWYVEAFRKGCRLTAKSTRGRFAVVESQSCPQDAPVPLTPTDGTTLTSPEVLFNWSPVEGAVAYELWVARGDGVETLVNVTRETSATMVLDEGKLRWFVRALFDGCQATRSQSLVFAIDLPDTCKGQPPFLLSPPIDEPAELANPIFFSWTAATGGSATPTYTVFAAVDDSEPIVVSETSATSLVAELPPGRVSWYVHAERPGCPPLNSSRGVFVVASPDECREPPPPAVRAVLEAKSGVPYTIGWLPGPNSGSFIIEESADEQFGVVQTQVVATPYATFVHEVEAPTRFFYRVFAVSDCDQSTSLPSETVRVIVTPKQKSGSSKVDDVHPLGTSGQVTIPIVIPGGSGKTSFETTFTASTTQPWMTVSPSSGVIPPEGITLDVTADTGQLGPGANTGSLVVTTSGGSGKTVSDGSTTTPVSVSLVAPVTPTSKSGPKPESLIIPAVGHAAGFNSQWQSDVRLTNIAAQATNYLLYFTPSGQAGTSTVKQASITVSPGETVALDDVVKSWFGIGADGSSATGTLEIRPQSNAITTNSSSSLANGTSLAAGTVASSRTYNLSTTGTFGQFIPAVAFANFAGQGEPLSLQQVSQSSQFRTNIGVAEGAGEDATVQFSVFTNDGQMLDRWNEELKPGEQRQFDGVIANRGLTLEGGRVEVEVVSETGKVTAYASTVDNLTGDPTFITPVNRNAVESESKLVVPGVADLDNGVASWRTDVRLYNAGDSSETVTLSYYAQGTTTPAASKQFTIEPGGVLEANDLLKTTFGITNSGGALHIESDGDASLVPTARTYNKTESGTYGQFIPAVSADKGARVGSAPLQLLQVEQSAAFRTNLGLAELSGNSVTVEVTAAVPGALIAPIKQYTLGANEFRQIGVILNDMGIPEAYNARVSIRVIDGGGSVSAYASVVDNSTQDPTYVPAQ